MRLAVHLNGVGAGKGTHVSIFLHQMVGEMDDELQWPFLLKVHIHTPPLNTVYKPGIPY